MEYLTALNTIFELTLLGNKTRIFKPDGFAIQRLDKGFAYFKKWADGLLTKGEFSSGVDSPHFIAWQVCEHNRCSCMYMFMYACTIQIVLTFLDMGPPPGDGIWIQRTSC